MPATTAWRGRSSYCALFVALSAVPRAPAQTPVRFRAEPQVRDLDGKTATGKLCVGGTPKLRMEFDGYRGPATIEWNIAPIAARQNRLEQQGLRT